MSFLSVNRALGPSIMVGICSVACQTAMLELSPATETGEEELGDWTVELHLYDYGLHEPIRWAQACIENMPSRACATSDETGLILLSAPSGSVVSVVVTAQDTALLPSRVVVKQSDILGYLNVPLLDASLLAALADAWGYPLLEDRSHILIRAEANTPDGGLSGVEFWRDPSRGQGPYYFDTMAQPNPSTTTTNENGYGFLLNGSEGSLNVGASYGSDACEANLPQDLLGDSVFTSFSEPKDRTPITVVTFDCDNVR